jgi:hypothetical protein
MAPDFSEPDDSFARVDSVGEVVTDAAMVVYALSLWLAPIGGRVCGKVGQSQSFHLVGASLVADVESNNAKRSLFGHYCLRRSSPPLSLTQSVNRGMR